MQNNNDITQQLMKSLNSSISNKLGEYVILKSLSRGSGGFVFLIKQRKTKKQYALKVIWKDTQKSSLYYAKIKNQIAIHQSLQSQYIAQLLTTFQDFDNYYLVLEYCSKGDLHQYTKSKQQLLISQIKQLGLQIAKGINVLHQKDIIHRDLKPQNILITQDKKAKICDFGFSVKNKAGQTLKDMVGTLNYVAPQIPKRQYDNKIDIWAYGCILYFMATGNNLFNFQNLKAITTMSFKIQFPNISNPLFKDLLQKILVVDPKQRLTIKQVLSHQFFKSQKIITNSSNPSSANSLSRTSSSRLIPTINNIHDQQINQKYSNQKMNKSDANSQKQNINTLNQPSSKNIRPDLISLNKKTQNPKKASIIINLQNRNNQKYQLEPLNVQKLRAPIMEIEHGKIKIDQNGITKYNEQNSSIFNVSPDGLIITVSKNNNDKIYKLSQLPKKYFSFYKYCNQVAKIVKNNSPKIKIQDRRGKFCIMWTGRMVAQFSGDKKVQFKDYSPPKQQDSEQIRLSKKYYKKMNEILQMNNEP